MTNLDYGIIGNCKSAALISKNASLEWLCLPTFEAPSVFASLLDQKRGGSFDLVLEGRYRLKQKYIDRTNLLVTDINDGENHFEIIDFMPRYRYNDDVGKIYAPPDLIRYFRLLKGKPNFSILYNPQLEYAEHQTTNSERSEFIKSTTLKGVYDSLYLYTNANKRKVIEGSEIELTEDLFFLISYNQKLQPPTLSRAYLKMQRTKVYWLNWSEKTHNFKQYNEAIARSALVLKLLTYDKTGAVLAAITTSLPEAIGEIRNWDYRFCWLRDASMVIKVMTQIGHWKSAERFLNYIIDLIEDKDEKIQIMYGINRQKNLTERILPHLAGYENSAPVRVGNAAYKQKQHDIYGILMDVIHQQFKLFDTTLQYREELWTITRSIVRIVEKNWQKPDRGIWEIRTEQRHFTFSKLLCWVAIDRAIKVGELLKQNDYLEKWNLLRNKINKDIVSKAWSHQREAYTQAYGYDDLDASILLMESFGFTTASDVKYVKTVNAIEEELMKNGLMYRYRNKDDFGAPTSSFTICTLWMIQALFKIGKREKAKTLFDQLLSYSNHLGLFSEDIDFESKRLLGNFPQGYSHLALIETALLFSGDSPNLNLE